MTDPARTSQTPVVLPAALYWELVATRRQVKLATVDVRQAQQRAQQCDAALRAVVDRVDAAGRRPTPRLPLRRRHPQPDATVSAWGGLAARTASRTASRFCPQEATSDYVRLNLSLDFPRKYGDSLGLRTLSERLSGPHMVGCDEMAPGSKRTCDLRLRRPGRHGAYHSRRRPKRESLFRLLTHGRPGCPGFVAHIINPHSDLCRGWFHVSSVRRRNREGM